MIDYLSLISKHTAGEHEQTVPAFIIHCALVTRKALDIAHGYLERNPDAEIDLRLLEEMGMVHDIGVFRTETPFLFTNGEGEYITHLTHGEQLLRDEGLDVHARAARSHHALDRKDIAARGLPLPDEDFVPCSPEEEILALADNFYSKKFDSLFHERSVQQVRAYYADHGRSLEKFDGLYKKYCE